MLPQKPPRTQNNSLLHSTWSVPLRSGDTVAYLGILLTTALYRTIDPCTVDRPGQRLTNMFQNAEHCLSKQVLSQHLTPQLSSIFPLSHLCLHKNQTSQEPGMSELLCCPAHSRSQQVFRHSCRQSQTTSEHCTFCSLFTPMA